VASIDLSHYVTHGNDGEAHIDLAVDGIDCAACIHDIEAGLGRLPGILRARVNYTLRRVAVDWRDGAIAPAAVVEALGRLGYKAYPFTAGAAEAAADAELKRLLRALAIAGFAAMNIMLLSVSVWAGSITDITPETRDFFHWLSALIALPAAAFAGQPFFQSAIKALRTRRTNMDVPISIGVTLALGVSLYETAISAEHAYFDSAVMLLFFLLAGRTLDHAMRRRTRAAAGNLSALRSETAAKLVDGVAITVPAAALVPGDTILVRPGDRIAADATVVAGESGIDESLVSGETLSRQVRAGATVYAGTLNRDATLTLAVSAAAGHTLVDEVQKLLDKASETRSRRIILADRAAQLYAPVVHLTAALAALGWTIAGAGLHQAVLVATTVLIITCPCALALAVPAVQVVAAGALFRRGIFLNAGDAIERLAEADTIVFDKTGTLTLPELRVANLASHPPELVQRAARLALSSRHPLAAALAAEAAGESPIAGAVEEPGRGIRAVISNVEARLGNPAFCDVGASGESDPADSTIAFRHGIATAVFSVRQILRPDAAATVKRLRDAGFDCRILSGDRAEAVAPVAAALGIERWAAGVRPAEKIAALEALAAAGQCVVMIGDGLNDAPALAAAHVSLSPISASDLAQAQADGVFLGRGLAPVAEAIVVARRARRLMTANLAFSVIYNFCAVPLAILGLVTPLLAALAMSGSSIVVTLNALRARPRDTQRSADAAAVQLPGAAIPA
jgi:Cu2+-exporting ATPase